jgi:RND family efflux transporter MFP subunit
VKTKTLLSWVAIAAGAAALYASGQHQAVIDILTHRKPASEKHAVAPPSVTVARVAPAEFVESVRVTGSLVAREEIFVSPEVEGLRVVEILVEQGDRVQKGHVMARLETETLDAQLAQNDAARLRAEAMIAQAIAQIKEVEARLAEAKASLERAKPLSKSGYLSESVLDQRAAVANSTAAQLAAAKNALSAAEAEKVQIAAQRRELAWRRDRAEVRAPVDGIVSRRAARIGTVFSSMAPTGAEPMFRIIQDGEIELDADVTETDLPKLSTGQSARIEVAGGLEVTGKIRLVSPEVDAATRLGRVRILIGADERLRIGTFASGTIETARERGLAVPVSAVSTQGKTASALVVVDETVESRPVITGLSANGLIEVKSGLAEGERVVARAGTFLNSGDRVRAVESPAGQLSAAQ